MGYGDEIMATGMARGLAARGQRAAFGDGRRILWSPQAEEVFRGNPNVARPGTERRSSNLVWFRHYRGHRLYAEAVDGHWVWNHEFRAEPGEFFFTSHELAWAEQFRSGFVVVEPHVKKTAPNKRWPFNKFQMVVSALRRECRVIQIGAGGEWLRGVEHVHTPSFRLAAALLQRAALYVGPEGGLHHAAAAVGTRAVVIFGGFIHPRTTGYSSHVNLFSGEVACGTIGVRCAHCAEAMRRIAATRVIEEAKEQLRAYHSWNASAGRGGAPRPVPEGRTRVRGRSDVPAPEVDAGDASHQELPPRG